MSKSMPETGAREYVPSIAGSANQFGARKAFGRVAFQINKIWFEFQFHLARERYVCFVWRRKHMFQVKCHAMISSDT